MLMASSVTASSATLTFAFNDYSGSAWWLKQTAPSAGACTSKGATTTHSLSTLTTNTSYTYKAYKDTDGDVDCDAADEIASADFTTP